MADRYLSLINSPLGKTFAHKVGMPQPAVLRRHRLDAPLLDGPVLLETAAAGQPEAGLPGLANVLAGTGLQVNSTDRDGQRWAGLVLDATALTGPQDLAGVRDFFTRTLRRLTPSGRVVVLGRRPDGRDPATDAARQALDGLVRSLAKELRAGATGNLVLLAGEVEDASALESTLRFFLSGRSAYVDGQAITVGAGPHEAPVDWSRPLTGRVAVVTGAARGIGAAIAEVLARDGARVVVADLPAAGDSLARVANRIGGSALQLDIAGPEAAQRLLDYTSSRFGGLDVLVHNAGITRDRLLANMSAAQWDSVLAVNLESQLRITTSMLESGAITAGSRVISLASTSGIAGNRGQTNYAASKAGVIGMVRSFAPAFAERGAAINAIAPGFIDTDMTHAMPFATREVARRLNSLQQAGLPVDVAEVAGWLSWRSSGGVNGQVVRVCGQNLVGA
jgi:3-oxoacyl-[acyl-carrier protein] reductase